MTLGETPAAPIAETLRSVEAARVRVEPERSIDPARWDAFAAECGGSFRCGYRASIGWQLDHHARFRMRRFAIWLEGRERIRIGQVAIGMGPRLRVFADGIQLTREYAHLWPRAMQTVLATTGEGFYQYGSRWSLEPARHAECAQVEGITVDAVKPITMYAVDFSGWISWDAYLRSVSENARRNAKKADRLGSALTIEVRRGWSMLRDASHLLRLRKGLYERKRIPFSTRTSTLRLLLRAWAMRERAFIAVARLRGNPISSFGGIVFGENTYFVDAGSMEEDHGIYWHLMLRMLRDAYERAPRGRFVTGAYYEGSPVSPGLDFFRHQCRAQGSPTSEFTFRYRRT